MTINALPALDRTSATFRSDTDQFFGVQLPAFASQANALKADVHEQQLLSAQSAVTAGQKSTLAQGYLTGAQAAATQAAASANFRGAWATLTGALARPASVSHAGAIWLLNTDLASIASAEPGVSASWTQLNFSAAPSLSGTVAVYVGQVVEYTITNYSTFSTYAASATAGAVTLGGAILTFTAPATAQTLTLTASANGASADFTLNILASGIETPTHIAPSQGAYDQPDTVALSTSAYAWAGSASTHASSDWQLAIDAAFTSIVQSTIADEVNLTSWSVSGLSISETYYWRVRYTDSQGVDSAWSAATNFATASAFASYIDTPAATPSAFGDSFEGGYYAGLMWGEVVQSASSYAISTGSKSFAVSDMTSAPLFYEAQTLEVRSRSNPVNKMIGTVTNALGTELTLNITSVGGSGTASDWSIMSLYRVILAPKSTGENSSIAVKNANTAMPTACQTLTEGYKATQAMVAADSATVYPAAHWCNNLTIGGKTDWYLPARDELELVWRNLKPVSSANYTPPERPTGQIYSYANNGSYGDTSAAQGTNNNSSPVGAANTSGSPAQAAATVFRTGGSEAQTFGANYYFSASEYTTQLLWNAAMYSDFPGTQDLISRSATGYVRAMRHSII
jgi:hypothetical protein